MGLFLILKKKSMYTGFMHGDLTNRNLLADVNGNCCLIDLDSLHLMGLES